MKIKQKPEIHLSIFPEKPILNLQQNIIQLQEHPQKQKTLVEKQTDYFLYYLVHRLESILQNQENTKCIVKSTQNLAESTQKDVSEIKQHLLKGKRLKKKKLPLRDPVTNETFFYLFSKPQEKRERILNYSRFRLAILLLWATGLRINEIRKITNQDLNTILKNKKLHLYQSKVNNYRELYFSDQAIKLLKTFNHSKEIVKKNNIFLGGSSSPTNWIQFINTRLKKYLHNYQFNIKSHSFRVNYVTQFLQNNPLHEARQIMGHRDIKTTLMYDRHLTDPDKIVNVLNKIQTLQ
jgi:integrase